MLDKLEELKSIADTIAAQFGRNTEVLIHDFTRDLNHTIVYIVNGHVTGRKIGGCASELFIKELKNSAKNKTKLRYISQTSDGKTLRSSTVNFFNDHGELIASICINEDISDLLLLEKAISNMSNNHYFDNSPNNKNDSFSVSIQDLLDSIIDEGLTLTGVSPLEMNKTSRIKFLSFLDEKGVFLIQKSGQKICTLLNISKFTLYNYLDEIRNSNTN